MSERYFSSPLPDSFSDFSCEFFQLWIFYLISSCKLLYDKLGVSTEIYLSSTELDSTSDPEECCSIFGDIIGRVTDIFVSTLESFSAMVRYKNPTPRRSRISTRSSVCIYDKLQDAKVINYNSLYFVILRRSISPEIERDFRIRK